MPFIECPELDFRADLSSFSVASSSLERPSSFWCVLTQLVKTAPLQSARSCDRVPSEKWGLHQDEVSCSFYVCCLYFFFLVLESSVSSGLHHIGCVY